MVGTEGPQADTAQQRWHVTAPQHTEPRRRPHRREVGGGLRTALAVDVGRLAARTSQRLGVGSGAVIGGRLALRLQPRVLELLTQGKSVVVVTGTNGKTTTTRMVAEALRTRGEAVSNATGANMLDGHVAALMGNCDARYAALEVDELHLVHATERISPAAVVLLNLTRDQLDRVGEIRSVEHSLREALRRSPSTHVVANRDDPNIVSAAADHPHVTWVSGGSRWRDDSLNCPRCGSSLTDLDGPWHCTCGLKRPDADWVVTDSGLRDPSGVEHEVSLALPGRVNKVNAAFALAASIPLGCEPGAALHRIAGIDSASGRYATVAVDGRDARLLLAKNPASWAEMLDLVDDHDRPLILAVNSREADGYDVSWLWDVDFECLRGRRVHVIGDRALDLAVRLRYAAVSCEVRDSVENAMESFVDEQPDVIANYTAFRDIFSRSVAR